MPPLNRLIPKGPASPAGPFDASGVPPGGIRQGPNPGYPVGVTEPLSRPCNTSHLPAGSCDCRICGWHVHDADSLPDAEARNIPFDGSCANGRPRADLFSQWG
jgi:hypothetical protein